MKDFILKYVEQGIPVFPCWKEKKNPVSKNGFYNATCDIQSLNKLFFQNDMLIGMPTGKITGIVVVDLDQGKCFPKTDIVDTRTVDELREELENNYGPIPDTFQVETAGGGRHFYYYAPDTKLSSSRRSFDDSLPIDIRANGGYVCAVDDENYTVYDDVDGLGIDNLIKRLTPLPEWIENFKKTNSPSEIEKAKNLLPESEVREIRSALNFIDADDRDNWVNIGMILKDIGTDQARSLWDEWSQKSDKYDAKDQSRKWNTFKPKGDKTIASIFFMAKAQGWTTTYQKKNEIILFEDLQNVPEILDKDLFPGREPFPVNLLNPGGLVGDIARFIVETAIRPQPIFALAGALCAVGTLAGRKYQTASGLRTNLYCLSVGTSGCGKEFPRQAIKSLFSDAGCDKYLQVESIASDASIVSELLDFPSRLFLLDEIGRFLKTTTSSTKSPHLYNVVSILLSLHSGANSTFYGKSYADTKRKAKLNQPNLCLYGTTVPESLYNGMTREQISDGFLARMLVFESDVSRPKTKEISNDTKINSKPVEIIDQIKALDKQKINKHPEGNLDHLNANPMIVKFSAEALIVVNQFKDFIEDKRHEMERDGNKLETLYNRTLAISIQIALILAIGKNIDNPEISSFDIGFGAELALYLANHMNYIAENFIAHNEFENEIKKIYMYIRKKGKMSLAEVTKITQHIPGHLRADFLDTLLDSDQIARIEMPGSGHKKTTWFFDKKLIKPGINT